MTKTVLPMTTDAASARASGSAGPGRPLVEVADADGLREVHVRDGRFVPSVPPAKT